MLLVASLLLVAMPFAPSSFFVTTSKALVTRSDALVPSSVQINAIIQDALWFLHPSKHHGRLSTASGRRGQARPVTPQGDFIRLQRTCLLPPVLAVHF